MKYNQLFPLILLILTSCSSFKPERFILETKEPQYSTWEEIFDHPSELHWEQWNTGWINCPTEGLIDIDNPNLPQMDEITQIPVPVLYVNHETAGNLLFDTGLEHQYFIDRRNRVNGILRKSILPEGEQREGRSISDRINQENINIKDVFLTHQHFDHTAGIPDLPGSVRIILGLGETPLEFPILFRPKHFDNIDRLWELNFEQSISIGPLNSVIDVYGDNSIFAIATPGHSKGHVSYLLNAASGPVLITGDICNIQENLDYRVGPGNYSSDMERAEESFMQILRFIELYPNTTVIMGHSLLDS